MSLSDQLDLGYRVAVQVIFAQHDRDIFPLYFDMGAEDRRKGFKINPSWVDSRTSIHVPQGEIVSLGSYFNAFPAGYWNRWTVCKSVRLRIELSGAGGVTLYRSNARGIAQRIDSRHVYAADHEEFVFDLPLSGFVDGGWYWFDLDASDADLVMHGAEWLVDGQDRPHKTATIATTTMNKTDYVVANMNRMAECESLKSVVDQLLIIDHGSQKVDQANGFAEACERLSFDVEVIEQANLGGSGGFARGQYEAATRGISDYVILLDDDITMEPESVVRMVTFADMCIKPTLVGGHMFDLHNRTVLHTMGEAIEPTRWNVSPAREDLYMRHNFASRGLRETAWMHSRVDVDYNGWWCCLIPTEVIRKIGLSLPLFIKWDDSEYGLRALKAGFPTVSLPGAALWHVSWMNKDDLVGWQAYFHSRNRMITALLHSPMDHGGQLLQFICFADLKYLVSMQYYSVAGRLLAEEDVLAGPESLHENLPAILPKIRAMAADYTDAEAKPSFEDFPGFPPVRPDKPMRLRDQALTDFQIDSDTINDQYQPPSFKQSLYLGGKALLKQLRPHKNVHADRPQSAIRSIENYWLKIAQFDSVLVTNADATGIFWYRRQPKTARRMFARSLKNVATLYSQWPQLAKRYRRAMDDLVSFEAWEKTFGITPDKRAESACS